MSACLYESAITRERGRRRRRRRRRRACRDGFSRQAQTGPVHRRAGFRSQNRSENSGERRQYEFAPLGEVAQELIIMGGIEAVIRAQIASAAP